MKQRPMEPEVKAFLDRVCGTVRAREQHADIRQELADHIEELQADRMAAGVPADEALREALRGMGDPLAIGRGLDQAHKPRVHWGILAMLAGLIAIAVLAMMNVQAIESDRVPALGYVNRKLVYLGLGLLVMTALWFLDYRIFKRWAEWLHAGSILLLLVLPFIGVQVNGRTMWLAVGGWSLDGTTVALVGMLIALAGMEPVRDWSLRTGAIHLAYRFFLPMALFVMVPALVNAMYFFIGFAVQAWLTRGSKKQFAAVIGVCVAPIVLLLGNSHAFMYRVYAFLDFRDTNGVHYISHQSLEAIRTAGWFGQGFAAGNDRLPYVYSDSWLPYFVYCFGWVAGLAFVALALMFIATLVSAAAGMKEIYARRLTAGIGAWLSVQFFLPVLMTLGWFPYVGVQLPIVSYGGLHTVLQFAALGLLLSAYRRRTMVRAKIG